MHVLTKSGGYGKGVALVGFVLLVGLSACGGASPVVQRPAATLSAVAPLPTPRYQITRQQNVAYGPLPAEKLDICEPIDAPMPRPGVLLLHGGGWTAGDKSEEKNICASLASQGFVVASVNYRLASSNPYAPADPKDMWPAQLVHVQLAVRWMRAQAKQLGLDATRLCAQGYSTGAHLVVFLGVLAHIHSGDEAGLLTNQSPQVSCVVDNYGPVDLTQVDYTATNAYFALFGAAYQSNPAVLKEASPIFDVSPQSVPMLIVQGTRDTTVPPAHALELQQALQHNLVPVQYISYDGGHAFLFLKTSSSVLRICVHPTKYKEQCVRARGY